MASISLRVRPPADSAATVVYLIDQAVGLGGHNQREDVALVQFFLRAMFEDVKDYKMPTGPPLVIDGICGPQTIEYIRAWQKQETAIAEGSFKLLQDGQISPALNHSWFGSISHLRYSIIALNSIYANTNGKEQHANISTDPRCPVSLLPSIFWA